MQAGSREESPVKSRVRLDVVLERDTYDLIQKYRLQLRKRTGRRIGSRTVLKSIVEQFFEKHPLKEEEKK